jgi:glyoxylase-like metal-dependent hydrolase (beta-lactamase superfamily II)
MALTTKIGRIEIIAICDFIPAPAPPTDPFPTVPIEAWEPYKESSLTADGLYPRNYGVFVLRSDDFTAIVDTGLGPGPHAAQNGVEGMLLKNLAAVGVQPEDVDGVINTHIHPDHVGWNLVDGKPTFPRARYTISRVDFEHWTSQDDAPAYVPDQVVPLEDMDVLDLVEDDQEIFIGVRTLGTPGHTPGHQSILIESGGEAAVVTGDVLHTPAQLQEPDWSFRADIDKEAAIASRKMLIEKAITEKLTVAAGHLRYDGNLGHVVEIEGRRYWQVLAD